MPNVFPDDILARIRALESAVGFTDDEGTVGTANDNDVEGGVILSYDPTSNIASVLLDNGVRVDAFVIGS